MLKTPKTKLQTPKNLQISSSNSAVSPRQLGFGAWNFSGAWCLGFGVCSSGKSEARNREYERPSLRLPPVAEEPRLHRRGRAHAGPGHWREHRYLQCRQRGVAAPVALRGIRSAGLVERTQPELSDHVSLLRELHRLAGAADGLRADRRL